MSHFSMNFLGSKIRARRKQLDLSQDDVADLVDVTQGAVNQWEQGLANITLENLAKLASSLQTTASELLSGNEPISASGIDETTLAMSIACLESELGAKFSQLSPAQKAKLLAYVYAKGSPLPKRELLSLLALVA